ncbi:MAG: quinone oxidoreductase [Gemmatimonadales bacterium]|nr:MAG: quinone oxidoreductase [Gemmatimonadales bacterium]
MNAIRFHETGGPEVLRLETLPDPEPGPGQVVVQVAAAGVNFIDTYHRSGAYPLELPTGLGLEGGGTVLAVGPGASGFAVGDRVAWADARGSYAERLALPVDRVVAVPEGVSLEDAASVMLQGMTAHYLAHTTWPLAPGDTALVYAAAGGVGRLLVQMAKERGARVLACTSTAEKEAEVRALGADEVIRYRDVDIVEEVRRLTDGRGVDVAYDSVGKDTFDASLASLRPRGMLVLYGQASGPVPPVDPQRLNRGGSLFLTRPSLGHYSATPEELRARAGEVLAGVGSGALDVRIHHRYPLADVAGAHADLEGGGTMGKLLVVP